MRRYILLLLLTFSLVSYGIGREEDIKNKREKNGIVYILDEKIPFTGKLVKITNGGRIKIELYYKEGKIIKKIKYKQNRVIKEINY